MANFSTSGRGSSGGGRNTLSRRTLAFIAGGLILLVLIVVLALVVSSLFSDPPDAAEVVQELRDESLPIGEIETYTAENDPNELLGRPGQYTGKVTFKDTRLPPDELAGEEFDVANGGSVETFDNEDDAARRQEYLETGTQGIPAFAEYTYREGTVLLRVAGRLTPDQAAEYEEALQDTS